MDWNLEACIRLQVYTGPIQSDTAYKTVSFWGQVKIKQINRSSILILCVMWNYYTENHI